MKTIHDVIIVGAGPVGLVLALILAEHGISFRIIDKRERWSDESKALTLTPRTLEILNLIGMADKFIQKGIVSSTICFYKHNRKKISSISFNSLSSPFRFILQLPQSVSTALLTEELANRGRLVERPLVLEGIESCNEGIQTCYLSHQNSGEKSIAYARYIVGCDGANSIVREIMGEKFNNEHAPEAFIMADIRLENHPFDQNRCMFYLKKKSSLYVMPIQEGYYRLISTSEKPIKEIDDPYVLERFRAIFKELGFDKVKLHDPLWISTFNPRQFVVHHYNQGNLFLAGDAAHIQSPVGSQGLNTGIQDAVNLGWKLAFCFKAYIKEHLLRTYHDERRPIAVKLFHYNNQLNRSVFGTKKLARAVAVNKRYLLNIPYFENKEKEIVSQLHLKYFPASLIGKLPGLPLDLKKKPLNMQLGHRFPYFELAKGEQLVNSYSLLSIKHYTLFIFTKDGLAISHNFLQSLEKTFQKIIIVECVGSQESKASKQEVFTCVYLDRRLERKKLFLCLVRPDSYIEDVTIL